VQRQLDLDVGYLEDDVDENAPHVHVATHLFSFLTESVVQLYRLLLNNN
jgi:hypothetical protein